MKTKEKIIEIIHGQLRVADDAKMRLLLSNIATMIYVELEENSVFSDETNKALQDELEKVNTLLSAETAKKERLKEVSSKEIERLQSACDKFESELEKVKSENESRHLISHELRQTIQSLKSDLAKMKGEYNSVCASHEQLEFELKAADSVNEALSDELDKMKEQAKSHMDELVVTMELANIQKKKWSERNESLQSELVKLREESQKRLDFIDKLAQEIGGHEATIQSLTEWNEKLTDMIIKISEAEYLTLNSIEFKQLVSNIKNK